MTTLGMVAALLAGMVIVGQGFMWSHGFSGAQLKRTELLFAIGGAYLVGTSLVIASILALAAPPDAKPEAWLHPFTMATGVVAMALGGSWAAGFKRYLAWSNRRQPMGTNHDRYPAVVWGMARWVPAGLMVFGGCTLVLAT